MRTSLRLAPALLLPVVMLTCGEPGGQTEGADTTSVDSAGADSVARSGSIEFESLNESGVTGTAHTERAAGDSAVLVLELQGLEEGTEYPAHVHQGTCEAGGPVAAPLEHLMGGADGAGSSRTTLSTAQFSDTLSYFIQVHAPGGKPAACVDVPAAASGESGSGGQQGASGGSEQSPGGA